VNDSPSASQRPTLLHLPPDVVDHTLGDIAVEFAAEVCGLHLYDWQAWALRNILARRSDGNWAARDSVLEIPRQNGKNSVLEALELYLIFLGGAQLVVHSAHEQPTAEMHFARLRSLIEQSDELLEAMPRTMNGGFHTANGKERIELADGRRIVFKTRTKKAGRGPSPDAIIIDEAMELDRAALGALTPSMSARRKAMLVFTSSSPYSHSEQMHSLRKRALSGEGGRLFYAGWNSDPDVDPRDEDNWFRCNPTLELGDDERPGKQIDAMRADLDLLSPEIFAVEHLGIPEEPESSASVIALDVWDSLEDKASEFAGRVVLSLDVSPDKSKPRASIGAAGRRDDGVFNVEVVESRPGTSWVVDALPGYLAKAGADSVLIDKGSPASSMIGLLEEAGVTVTEVSTADHARAVGMFLNAVHAGQLRHTGQQSLRSAVVAATLRPTGDAELWSRRSSKMDISPLVAVTIALGAVPEPADSVRELIPLFGIS
jgi:phage terminase large subunit-like protein